MRSIIILLILIILPTTIVIAQLPQLHIIGEPELSLTDIVAVRDDRTGQFCSAIQIITDLEGFGYSSDIGVVRVDFSRPGKDMVFLLPDERILEIYHPDFLPLKIIFSEMDIKLQPKQMWIIKLTGDKKITDGIPILIETNTDSVEITIDGKSHGKSQALVSPGKHEIQLFKTDYETIADTIWVDENNKRFEYTLLVKQVMVFVKGGTFQMGDTFGDGSANEKPVHEVKLSDFYISKYEVTNAQFCKFLNEKGNQREGNASWIDIGSQIWDCLIEKKGEKYIAKFGYENHPVVVVSWYGAKAYCEWIGARLPTEAEWEYAAKGGNKSKSNKYSGSNNLEEVAWSRNNSGHRTHPVGSKQPNELALYDMSGNVFEWCADWYGEDFYRISVKENPTGPISGKHRVMRGGSFSYIDYARCACRIYSYPHSHNEEKGFRYVR